MPSLNNSGEWIDFKKAAQAKGTSILYCYGCGSPLGEYMPECHRRHAPGKKCPWNDFMGITLWILFNDQALRHAAKAVIPGSCQTLDYFAQWCTKVESHARFCNGVHVFLWFCEYRGLM